VDGAIFAACDIDVALQLGLRSGLEMTDVLAERLRAEDRRLMLRQKVYHFATYKPRTVSQVRRKLEDLEAVPDEVETLLGWVSSFGIVDDAAYAVRYVQAADERKPMSPAALRRALRVKGIADVHIDVALAGRTTEDAIDAARRVAEKKLRMTSGSETERRQKLVRFLQYRGYAWDVIRKVIDEVASGH
jgi:regulatory protein